MKVYKAPHLSRKSTVSKVPRLSRKTPRRQFDPGCPPASADLYEGLQSVTPVTQSLLLSHARPCVVVVVVVVVVVAVAVAVAVAVVAVVVVVVVVDNEEEEAGGRWW